MSLEAQLVIGPYRAHAKPHLEGGVAHSCDALIFIVAVLLLKKHSSRTSKYASEHFFKMRLATIKISCVLLAKTCHCVLSAENCVKNKTGTVLYWMVPVFVCD